VGKPMLQAYKRALSEDVALFELFDTLLVMLVLIGDQPSFAPKSPKPSLAHPRVRRTFKRKSSAPSSVVRSSWYVS
jgi:hypothetical protein